MPETVLRQPVSPRAPSRERVAAHNARSMNGSVLITAETGDYAELSAADYDRYLAGEIGSSEPLGQELARKQLLRDQLDFQVLTRRCSEKNLLEWKGPNVHTVVVTLRCNFKCLYCHASVVDPSRVDKDMSLETARQVVDLIFQSPSPSLMIEFQGGEPLLNWPVLKFIVEYAELKNRTQKRSLRFGLISNLSLLDDEKLDFLVQRRVSLCTSVDGPEALHNKNRVYLGGNSHADAVAGLRRARRRIEAGAAWDAPNAVCTVTRFSLGQPDEIVDELVGLGLERIQLGPLDPIGFAKRSWSAIGYSPEEFTAFYARALDHLIELNRRGVRAYEKTALILLLRILEGAHWRFPNADVLARVAYNHDGGVYTCEEGRLLANAGDEFFKIGTAAGSDYYALLDHVTTRASLLAASPNSQPQCFQCAYKPYCTIWPVYNHQTQASLWGRMPDNGWCRKIMGIFDVLFERLRNPATRAILESWLQYKDR